MNFKATKIAVFVAAASLLGGCAQLGMGHSQDANSGSSSVHQYAGDTAITSKIKAKYVKDLALKSFNVSVSTNQGVVSLVGNLPSNKLRHRAIHIAKHTAGVKGVNASNLTVTHHKHKVVQAKPVAKVETTKTVTTTTTSK